jgi:hypothetical protein
LESKACQLGAKAKNLENLLEKEQNLLLKEKNLTRDLLAKI